MEYVLSLSPVEDRIDSLGSVESCYLSTVPFTSSWDKSWWGGVA